MHVALLVAEIVAPVIVLGLVGFLWVRSGAAYPTAFVTQFVMKLSIPCLLFATLVQTKLSHDVLIATGIAALLAHLALAVIFLGLIRILKLDLRTYLVPLVFGNTGNLGLPLALFAFKEAGLDLAVVVFSVSALLMFTLGLWSVAGGRFSWRLLKEPVTPAILLAILVLALGLSLPKWVISTLDLLGQPAIPLMLVTLGVAISSLSLSRAKDLIWISFGKLGIAFATTWCVATALALPPLAFAILVVQMSTPVAVTSAMMAEAHGADGEAVAGLVLITTMASILTLPLILSLFV